MNTSPTRRRRARILMASLAAVGGAVAAVGTAGAVPTPRFVSLTDDVFISELHYDNVGVDAGESIEVTAPAGMDMAGWSIVLYNGSGGTVYTTTNLTGIVPGTPGTVGAFTVTYPENGIQNGAPDGIALVAPSGVLRQFLSYEGVFAGVGGAASGITSTNIGVFELGGDPLGLSLQLVQSSGTGAVYGDYTWIGPAPSNFAPPLLPPPPPPSFCPDLPAVSPISQVQGSGSATPCAGEAVAVEGVVVGDYEGAAPALRGFYVQSLDASADADAATSEGVFVFNANNNSVELGDHVRVTGVATEFQDQTQIAGTTAVPLVVDVLGDGSVTPAVVELPVPTASHLERFEGMVVSIPQDLYVTEHFQLGRFGEVLMSGGGRLDQPTSIVEPGPAAQALQAANDLNQLLVDDTLQNQNADPILFGRGGEPLSASNTLRGGDTLTGATGVLTYTWGGNASSPNAYRLRPVDATETFDFEAVNERPTAAPEVGGTLVAASFNVLNYFTTIDRGGSTEDCGPIGNKQECRGADSVIELERQRTKLLSALLSLDADVIGLVELENTELADGTPVEPLADIVAGLNAATAPGTFDYVSTGTIGTDTIRVGLVYRTAAAAPFGGFAVLDSAVDARFDDSLNRPSLAQSFVDMSSGEIVTVVVNHLKSKGSCPTTLPAEDPDQDQGDGAGCWNAARESAAEALVDWLGTNPTGVVDTDHLVIGDLNSYAKEDPIDRFVDAGYVDLALEFAADGEKPYSYVFDGQWGYLDYALASPSLAPQVTGVVEHHINADEPTVLDYNTDFKSAGQVTSLYAPDEFRTSDHDPIVVGLGLSTLEPETVATPDSLWPPNHKLRDVELSSTSSGLPLAVTVFLVSSSEADSGLGEDDVPGDIVVVDADSLQLRAERFVEVGRTYTVDVVVTDGFQSHLDSVDVVVAGSQARRPG
jgi:predicted extracellular nuclease